MFMFLLIFLLAFRDSCIFHTIILTWRNIASLRKKCRLLLKYYADFALLFEPGSTWIFSGCRDLPSSSSLQQTVATGDLLTELQCVEFRTKNLWACWVPISLWQVAWNPRRDSSAPRGTVSNTPRPDLWWMSWTDSQKLFRGEGY